MTHEARAHENMGIEQKTAVSRGGSRKLSEVQVVLRVAGRPFHPDEATSRNKAVLKAIRNEYLRAVEGLVPAGRRVIVKLGGLHFRIEDVTRYVVFAGSRTNMILGYHSWKDAADLARDEDCFAIMECDRRLFRSLLGRFWFSLGYELRFEAFVFGGVLTPGVVQELATGKVLEGLHSRRARPSMVIDNCEGGFHFRILYGREHTGRVKECLGNLEEALNGCG